MTIKERGIVQDGVIILPGPIELPNGTPVEVSIELVNEAPSERENAQADFRSLPVFGMWADREDMQDSAEWVHQERQKWHQRLNPSS